MGGCGLPGGDGAAFVLQAVEEIAQRCRRQKHLAVGGVGARDIDGEEPGERGKSAHQQGKIGDGVMGVGVGGEIDTEDLVCRRLALLQTSVDDIEAIIVKSHAVDDGAVAGQAKQSGARIAALGFRGDTADLDKSQTQLHEPPESAGILVEAGGRGRWDWRMIVATDYWREWDRRRRIGVGPRPWERPHRTARWARSGGSWRSKAAAASWIADHKGRLGASNKSRSMAIGPQPLNGCDRRVGCLYWAHTRDRWVI